MDYDYESIDSGIKDKIITEIEAEIKKDNSKFFEEQPPITINSDVWANLDYPEKDTIQNAIFGANLSISLTREQVFDETETETKIKIMKVLMWGYQKPSGRPNKAVFESIAKHLGYLEEKFKERFDANKARNLNEDGIKTLFKDLKEVSGLGGIVTKSKLLYFFNFYFEGKRCLIYDSNVMWFLNHDEKKLTLCEDCYGKYLILNSDSREKLKDLVIKAWEDTDDCYFKYLGLMNDLMSELKKDPGIRKKIENLIKEKEEKKIEEKIYEQIEFYMFTKGKELAKKKR